MKTYTKKQITKQLIIGGVLSVITLIVMLATGIWDIADQPIGGTILLILGVFTLMPISYMSFFYINWKKALIGMIAPIPVLSYCIACFKGLGYTFMALITLIKGKDNYTFNKYGVDKNNAE